MNTIDAALEFGFADAIAVRKCPLTGMLHTSTLCNGVDTPEASITRYGELV